MEKIAEKYPLKIVKFFEKRVNIELKKSRGKKYTAIPYDFHKLSSVLEQNAKVVIPEALKYFNNKWSFNWDWGHFLKNTYSLNDLDSELVKLLSTGKEKDEKIVLSILTTYRGRLRLDSKTAQMLARKFPKHHGDLMSFMSATDGVLFSESGLVDFYKAKKKSIQKWKGDKRKYIQNFVKKYEKYLDIKIDYEKKRVDEDLALRKHEYM